MNDSVPSLAVKDNIFRDLGTSLPNGDTGSLAALTSVAASLPRSHTPNAAGLSATTFQATSPTGLTDPSVLGNNKRMKVRSRR